MGSIKVPTLAIGIDSDILFPTEEQKFIAKNIPEGRYAEISSVYGHDGFLLEWESISNAITDFLKQN